MKYLFITIVLLFITAQCAYGYGEGDTEGNPNWTERESLTLINAVRISPSAYKTNFMPASKYSNLDNILTSSMPPVPPIYYNNTWNRLAKAHSYDMAINNCFSHDNCNGTAWDRYVYYLGSCRSSRAENIAYGPTTGVAINNLLLCEDTQNNCIADGSPYSEIGHRVNIMSATYKVMGVGTYKASTLYSTQDFGSGGCETLPTTPIHQGSHTFNVSSNVMYIVSYSSKTPATSAKIYIEGTGYDLTRLYGDASVGFYIYKPATYTACQKYSFEFKTSTATYLFPETGSLTTATTSNDCTNAWSSTNVNGGTTSSSTSNPTTSSTSNPTTSSTSNPTTSSTSNPTTSSTSNPTTSSSTSNPTTSSSSTSNPTTSSSSTGTPTSSTGTPTTSAGTPSSSTSTPTTSSTTDDIGFATKTTSSILLLLVSLIVTLL